MTVFELPKIYTLFNACALLHITLGLVMIKMGQRKAHVASMTIALLFSAAFLGCYLYYHYHAGHVKFAGTGMTRPIYFILLFTHIPLAVLVLPLLVRTVWPAWKGDFVLHRKRAKVTFPVWLYVSVTGVLVYLMLYVWFPPAGV